MPELCCLRCAALPLELIAVDECVCYHCSALHTFLSADAGGNLPAPDKQCLPRKAPNSFMLFCQAERQTGVDNNKLSAMWAGLTDEQKLPWKKKASDAQELYQSQKRAWLAAFGIDAWKHAQEAAKKPKKMMV